MLIVKQIKKTEEGHEVTWSLSEEQMQFLLTFAINSLLGEGLISIEERNEVDERQQQHNFLQDVPVEALGKAS